MKHFDVYHGPITSTYGKVWWTKTSNDLPDEIVQAFDGKTMACVPDPFADGAQPHAPRRRSSPSDTGAVAPRRRIIGMESDQVRKGAGPNGEDVSVPITMSYNHHHDTAVVGKGSHMEQWDLKDAKAKVGRKYVRLDKGKAWVPVEHTASKSGAATSAMFSDGNGGECELQLPPSCARAACASLPLSPAGRHYRVLTPT